MDVTVAECVRRLKTMMDATAPAGFTTSLGPPNAAADIPTEYGAVMYGGDDRAGLVGAADRSVSYGNGQDGQRFAVWCCYSTATGDVDPLGRLARVEALFDDFQDSLMEDSKLGGLLVAGGQASIGGYEWTMEDGGTIVTVFFQVDVMIRW